MKTKLLFLPLLFLFFSMDASAQVQNRKGDGSKALERIEQMEHARLIEILDMNEETAIKFFARRKEYRAKMGELFETRYELMKGVDALLKDGGSSDENKFKEKLNDLLDTDSKIFNEKKAFYKSISGLLSPKQILKMALFDEKTRREIRETLMHKMKQKER